MRIALLSTPYIAIPPQGYGGIELVVHHLSEGLIKKGHEVFLFATGDSKTKAKLGFYYKKAIGNKLEYKNQSFVILPHLHQFFKFIEDKKIDIIHNHCGYEAMYLLDLQKVPFVHTLHGAFYKGLKSPSGVNEKKRKILKTFKNHPFVSISNQQRQGMPDLNYIKTVYNGIKIDDFPFKKKPGQYLVYLGRITPNKGLDIAIKVAKKINLPLRISGYIDPGDKPYFQKKILPLIKDNKKIKLMNEFKSKKEKAKFFGNALCFLFPIRWHEPYGIVMVESMATGTPVVAFNKGSVPEVIKDKKTGFIVNDEDEMIEAIKKIDLINRLDCRKHVEDNFTIEKMVNNYIKVYEQVISNHSKLV